MGSVPRQFNLLPSVSSFQYPLDRANKTAQVLYI